jgi:hypothetical protein
MAASSSTTLLQTTEWSKKLNFGRRSALGNFLEPAITSANIIRQMIMGAPFTWRWNRVVTGFITTAGQQDYTLFNWAASTNVQSGWLTVDDAGNSQQVTTAGTTGTVAPTWNHTSGGTTDESGHAGTAVWTNLGSINETVSQTYTFAWMETVAAQDVSLSVPKWFEIETKLVLGSDSAQSRPRYIAAQGDDGAGNITFRMMPVPDAAYPIALTIQQKPPLFTGLNQPWSPIPDEFSRIYTWGFLSLMYLFADDARFTVANGKFVSQLLGASEGLTETQRNIFLENWQALTGQPIGNQDQLQQGNQARGS